MVGLVGIAPAAADDTASPDVLLSDDFDRTAPTGWGTSDNGLDYSSWSSRATVASVADGAAALTLNPGESAYLTPQAVQAQDVRISADLRLDRTGGRGYYAYTTRVQKDGSAYRVRLLTDAKGQVQLSVIRTRGGVETELKSASVPLSILGDGWYTFDATVTGTDAVTFEARLTPAGTTPGAPQLTVTDSSRERLAGAGGFAMWGYASSSATAPVDLQIDSLEATVAAGPLDRKSVV